MKKTTGITALIWVFAVLPLILTAMAYPALPERIIVHWGADGAIGYGAKIQIWWIAGLTPIMALLMRVLPKIDPKKRNYQKFNKPYRMLQLALMIFFCVVTGIVIYANLYPNRLNIGVVVTLMIGVLFIVIGNMMPKFRHNYFCGIRTAWTLASPVVWAKTNRLGGRLFFAVGLLLLPSVLLAEPIRMVWLLVLILLASLIPCVMSYIWYRQEEHTK